MNEFYWIQIGLDICFLTLIFLFRDSNISLMRAITSLSTPKTKDEITLANANVTIRKIKKENYEFKEENRKLKIALDIKVMNDALEEVQY